MTRILITGGAGYVGSVSVEAFLAAGYEVVVLDDLTTGHRSAVPAGATLHIGTYADTEALSVLLRSERIDAIRALPNGSYEHEVWSDGFEEPIRIHSPDERPASDRPTTPDRRRAF